MRPQPRRARRDVRAAAMDLARLASAPMRRLPDVLVIGAQKSGTTALHDLLLRHPQIVGAAAGRGKELHHFDQHPDGSLLRYRASFPIRRPGAARERTLESTPSYLFHPAVPAAVARSISGVRAIAVLREPVDRTWSHYAMAVRRGREHLSIADALALEGDRTARGREMALAGKGVPKGDPYYWCSYAERSRYVAQVERWRAALGSGRLLVLRSEDLWADRAGVLGAVFDFLGVDPWLPSADGIRRNESAGPPPSAAERAVIEEHLAGATEGLHDLVGFDWSELGPRTG